MGAFFRRCGSERDLVGDGQAVAFERDDFSRVIGEHAQVLEAEIDQDLRADAAFVLQEALPRDIHVELAARVIQDARQRARSGRGGVDAEASAGVVQVDEHAAILPDDGFERALDDFVAIAFGGRENIAGEAVRMHAHQRRPSGQISAHQRDVLLAVHVGGVDDHAEIAVARGQSRLGDAPDVALVPHPVANQFRDGQQLQPVRAAEFRELRQARHRAVVIHDFADHARGSEPGDARQIHRRFGLPGAHQHAAISRAQGENVSRARQIGRARCRVDGREDGDRAIGGADSRGRAAPRVDRFA